MVLFGHGKQHDTYELKLSLRACPPAVVSEKYVSPQGTNFTSFGNPQLSRQEWVIFTAVCFHYTQRVKTVRMMVSMSTIDIDGPQKHKWTQKTTFLRHRTLALLSHHQKKGYESP